MGTNYDWLEACPHCGGRLEGLRLHIGKSSAGWCFSLRVHPDRGIHSLEDWKKRWESGGEIVDEYNRLSTVPEMLRTILDRGPNLLRHEPRDPGDRPGDGTYDITEREFS
jgi:hypothetical protein